MDRMNVMGKRTNSKTLLFFLFLNILVLTIMLGCYFSFAQIELIGKEEVVLNYKEKYIERGFVAKRFNRNIDDLVKVSGFIDTTKLGTYKITYEVSGVFGKKVVRTVKVKDTEKPVILLDSNENIVLCPGHQYQKEKVNASDNYDGDLRENVKIEVTTDKVIYSVEDSSKNKVEVVKKIVYEDKVSPVININGSKYLYAFVGEGYVDLGSSAVDNCSGDITSKIMVENNVNTNVSGNYQVKYSVTDESGNKTEASRMVVVSHRNKVGTIYLTFDDGPKWGTTDAILDILKEEGVEATFFVTNGGPDELIKRIYDEGHTVALHTATHNYATVYASIDSYFNDLNIVNERVKRITGQYSYIIRFPGGSSNTISRRYSQGIMSVLTQEVLNRGYKYYDWNISSGDAAGGSPTPEQIKNNVISNLDKSRVNMVLMHDIKTYTRDALREIIQFGKNNSYTFEKITMDTEMVKQRVNN